MTQTNAPSSPYRPLLPNASTVTATELWRETPVALRATGLRAQMENAPKAQAFRAVQIEALKAIRGFRPQAISAWTIPELAQQAARIARPTEHLVSTFVTGYFLYVDRQYQSAFFDLAEIPHENGHFDGLIDALNLSDDRVALAVRRFAEHFGDDPSAHLYLLALCSLFSANWPGIQGAVEDVYSPLPETAAAEQRPASPDAIAPPDEAPADAAASDAIRAALDERPRLDALDHLMIREVVRASAAAESEGEDIQDVRAVTRAVQELIRTNPIRHQSYHHLGFLDALLSRPPATRIPAENDDRRRWYSAGWVAGRARVDDFEGICRLFDADERVRRLNDSGAATEYAATSIVKALARLSRHAEASRFVRAETVLVCDEALIDLTIEVATDLLRDERGSDAMGYLESLESGLDLRETVGSPVDRRKRLDVRRRLAHCHRQQRSFEVSRQLLEGLLHEELTSRERAMIFADLGLMDADRHRLSAITVPATHEDAAELQQALHRGVPRFLQAEETDAAERVHGSFPLGVLNLLDGRYVEAFERFERARVQFAADPKRYSGDLIPICEHFEAIAGLLSHSTQARVKELANQFVAGLRKGQPTPTFLIEQLLIGALEKDPRVIAPIVDALLEQTGEGTLDAIRDLKLAEARRPVTNALLARLDATTLRGTREAALIRTAVQELASLGEVDRIGPLLAELDAMAERDIGTEDLLALLDNTDLLGVAFDADERDAGKIWLFERAGRYVEAATVVTSVAHRLLSGARYDAIGECEDLVDRVRGYGAVTKEFADELEMRLAGVRDVAEEPPDLPRDETFHAHICIVGGNEVQARYAERLKSWASTELNVELSMILSGWTSNWNSYLADFKRLKPRLDGVAVLRFTRTEFGRAVRKQCDGMPQLGTFAHGEKGLQRAVIRVAEMIRIRNQERLRA